MRKIALMLIFTVFILSGCTGYRESTSTYIVSAIGIDKSERDYLVSVQVVEASADKTEGRVFSSSGDTIDDAIYSVTAKISKALSFDHCGIVAVGKNINGKYLKETLDYCKKNSKLNLSVYIVSCENAKQLLEVKETSSVTSGYDLMGMIENYRDKTGVNLQNRFYETEMLIRRENNVFALPFFTIKDEKAELDGRKVYRDYNHIISLDNNESVLYSVLCDTSKKGSIAVKNTVVNLADINTTFSLSEKSMSVSIKTKLYAKEKSKDFTDALNVSVNSFIDRIKDEKAGDIFGFYERIYRKNRKLWTNIGGEYNDLFNSGEIKIDYNAEWVKD